MRQNLLVNVTLVKYVDPYFFLQTVCCSQIACDINSTLALEFDITNEGVFNT